MGNLFANACIALCCLTCVEHHDEVCGMQPQSKWVLNEITDRVKEQDAKIVFP